MLKTTLQGGTLQEIDRGLPDRKIRHIEISPRDGQDSLILATTWEEGVFQSQDKGQSWQQLSQGLTKDEQADVAAFTEPHFRMVRFSPHFTQDRTLYLAGFNGLFQSTNAGKQWQELETLSTRTITALAISPNYAKDGTVAFGTYEQEGYISHDRGNTWKSMLNGLSVLKYNPGAKQTPVPSTGIVTQNSEKNKVWEVEPPRFYDLLFSPQYASDRTLFASLLYKFTRTTDGGQSWSRTPFPEVEADVANRDIFIAVSPNYAQDRITYAASKYGGIVYQSKNGGQKFTAIGKIENSLNALAISPNFADDRTLFASNFREGIYRSTDRGRTWQNVTVNSPLNVSQWLHPVISPNYQADRTVLAATNRGIVQTQDGGVTWSPLDTTPYGEKAFIEAIAFSPNYKSDRTFIAVVRGYGLWKTTDAGQTFKPIGRDLIEKNYPFSHMVMSASVPIQFSPTYAQDNTLYGFGSTTAEVYRSTDGGETWDVLSVPRQVDVKAAFFNYLKLFKVFFRVYPHFKLVVGAIAALFTYWLLGRFRLEKRLPIRRWQLRGGGASIAFIALWVLLSD
jgi:photosystem II stability/assembly factor-like uncharacterized protein